MITQSGGTSNFMNKAFGFIFVCAGLLMVSAPFNEGYAACKQPPLKLYWTSVDAQSEVSRDAHILLSFNQPDEVQVSLDGEELVPEEITDSYARYAHPETTSLGPKSLTITLSRGYGSLPEGSDIELPEPVRVTRQYTLVESSEDDSTTEVSILGARPGAPYQERTVCDKIFNDFNCFDTGEPTIQDLTLSSLEHPYFVEEYVTTFRGRGPEQVWQASGLYPGECAPPVENAHWPFTCWRIVTLDEQGRRYEGSKQCDLMGNGDDLEDARRDDRDSGVSCSTSSVLNVPSNRSLLWLFLLALSGGLIRLRTVRSSRGDCKDAELTKS